MKIYVINTLFCVVFLLVPVLQSSPIELPLKWPALRNKTDPLVQVGQARAVFEGYYAKNLARELLKPGRRRVRNAHYLVLTARATPTIDVLMILFQVSRFINRVNL